MLSRMYLGAHYLTDVLAGGLLGLVFAYGFYLLFTKVKDKTLTYRIIMISVAVIVVATYVYYLFTTSHAQTGVTDARYIYDGLSGLFKMSGAMFGFFAGTAFEKAKVKFTQHKVFWKNLLRFVFGVAIVMGVRYLLKAVFGLIVDEDSLVDGAVMNATLMLLLDMLRYMGMVFIGIGLYPLLFKSVRI